MEILGMPGIKPATANWMSDLFVALGEPCSGFRIANYRHWAENCKADVNYEASCLENASPGILVAKSFGTVVSSYAFSSFNFRPKKAIFIGTPLQTHSRDSYRLLETFVSTTPTIFIQQTADFLGSYQELSGAIETFNNARAVEVPGNDHAYSKIELLKTIIEPELFAGA